MASTIVLPVPRADKCLLFDAGPNIATLSSPDHYYGYGGLILYSSIFYSFELYMYCMNIIHQQSVIPTEVDFIVGSKHHSHAWEPGSG